MSFKKWLGSIFTPHPNYFTVSGSEMIDPRNAALYEAVRSQMKEEQADGLGVQVDSVVGSGGLGGGDVVHHHPDSNPSLVRSEVLSSAESASKRS